MQKDQEHIWTVEELIEDERFIAYVQLRATADQRAFWDAYCMRPEVANSVDQARQFIQALAPDDRLVADEDIEQVRQRIQQAIPKSKSRRLSLRRSYLQYAAALIGLLVAGFFLVNNLAQVNLQTAHGEIQNFVLPDGSEVVLNASSSLRYKKSSFNKSDRILHLEGQAFFKVNEGKPFVVETAEGSVTVLGTSFDVYQRNDELIVGCKTGQVRVTDHAENSAILSPGQEVFMSSNKMKKIKKSLDKIGTWGKGTFYYDSVQLRKILDEVERQFNAKIVCQPVGLGDQLYSGYFINTHLDSALMSICWPLRIQYEHRDNRIIVSRQ